MRRILRNPSACWPRLTSALLWFAAAISLAGCDPQPPSRGDGRAAATAERPEPSYRGPARPIHGRERLHRVERADTITSIAEAYGLAPEAIERINGLRRPYQLFVGEFLILPDTRTWVAVPAAETVVAHPVEAVEAQPLPGLE